MNEHDALYAAILSHPGEDTPKLVYADWLDERAGPGDHERASEIRAPNLTRNQVRGRTKTARAAVRMARRLLGGSIPKTWQVWPVEYPLFDEEVKRYAEPGEMVLWESACGASTFMCSRPPFAVGIRHGFVEAVAAPRQALAKCLSAVIRVQPVACVAANSGFFEFEHFLRPIGWGGDHRRRCVRRDTNGIPPDVFRRLAPRPEATRREVMCVYPDLASAYKDLGRAYLEWARDGAKGVRA